LNSGLPNLALKLEISLYRVVHNIRRYVKSFNRELSLPLWKTDGQTDRQTERQMDRFTIAIARVVNYYWAQL